MFHYFLRVGLIQFTEALDKLLECYFLFCKMMKLFLQPPSFLFMILRSCAQISVSLESTDPYTPCPFTCYLDSFLLHPQPLKLVSPFMYGVSLNLLKKTPPIYFVLYISQVLIYKLQGAETISNPNLVFFIVQRISILYIYSTRFADRQIIYTMNMYALIGFNCLVGNYVTDNKLLLFKLKSKANILTVQI